MLGLFSFEANLAEKDFKQRISVIKKEIKDFKKGIKGCEESIKKLKTITSMPYLDLAKSGIEGLKRTIKYAKEMTIERQNYLAELHAARIKKILKETNQGKVKFKVIQGGLYENA